MVAGKFRAKGSVQDSTFGIGCAVNPNCRAWCDTEAEAKVGIQHVGIMSSNMHQNNITSLSKVGEQFANGLQRKRIPVPSWLKLLILYVSTAESDVVPIATDSTALQRSET
ncbi:hypothetical protein DVH24_007324 [Malus domestica]|uniref:Uncharacterized protein n=1 Tax=Malus domestica TaxID=3750 RepID=A0A498HF17_MALDO|nr:hypothetical protein DVH24_007324 [Malus domestica]